MADLLFNTLVHYPILESFASQTTFYDLLAVSRLNSFYRALLRGLHPPDHDALPIYSSNVRQGLYIGQSKTRLWTHLLSKTTISCAEPGHKKGPSPQGCRMCSKPICTACIVKMSFHKKENTFSNRWRMLCKGCWQAGNPHVDRLQYHGNEVLTLDYPGMDICRCVAGSDGFLCLECKERQNSTADKQICAGRGCENSIQKNSELANRVCLWCKLALPGLRSQENRRKAARFMNMETALDSQVQNDVEATVMMCRRQTMDFQDQRALMKKFNPPRHVFEDDEERRNRNAGESISRAGRLDTSSEAKESQIELTRNLQPPNLGSDDEDEEMDEGSESSESDPVDTSLEAIHLQRALLQSIQAPKQFCEDGESQETALGVADISTQGTLAANEVFVSSEGTE